MGTLISVIDRRRRDRAHKCQKFNGPAAAWLTGLQELL